MPIATAAVRHPYMSPAWPLRFRTTGALPASLRQSVRTRALDGTAVTPLGTPPVHFSADPNAIVSVQVSTITGPTPNTYQQCGALVSFGATSLAAQDVQLLTELGDLTDASTGVVIGPAAVSSTAWAAGTLTVTTTAPLPADYTVGNNPRVVLAGFVLGSPNTWPNGAYAATVTGPDTFTVPITADPGHPTTMGTWQPQDAVELSQMATTYFSQGNQNPVWVLECGASLDVASEVAALQTWLTSNPRSFYGYLMPRRFGVSTANLDSFKPVLAQYQAPEAMTYFWLTVTPQTMNHLGPTFKDVIQLVEAPSVTDPTQPNAIASNGEFSMAAMFYNGLNFVPSQINRIAPMAFKYLFGVTPYPTKNNGPLLSSFKSNFTNYVATGAQGGISDAIVYEGVALDGSDYFNWWWTIDYAQIRAALDVSNAVINGSNNPLAPLYYEQTGINFLLATLANTAVAMSNFGMIVGPIIATGLDQPALQQSIFNGSYAGACNVNAVPFLPYQLSHPGDYKIGEYDGLSMLFIPARGFIHVLITIVATDLASV